MMYDKPVYQHGNTIRLTCEFFDFDGIPKSPDDVKIRIYDYKYNVIDEFNNATKTEEGKYYFDYVSETENKTYYYEWYGQLDGTPSLRRGSFITKFI